ncbi:hypothetical protein BH11PSE11_BH11PSE11_38220 [soil metagenome]
MDAKEYPARLPCLARSAVLAGRNASKCLFESWGRIAYRYRRQTACIVRMNSAFSFRIHFLFQFFWSHAGNMQNNRQFLLLLTW